MRKLGLEMEMVVAAAAGGRSHAVDGYFEALARMKASRGEPVEVKRRAGRAVAVLTPAAESGLDNAFNHLESALAPVPGGAGGLDRLEAAVARELDDVAAALQAEGAILLNASEHPDCGLDDAFYRAVRAPKPIYDYWVGYRGWRHQVGIDAKAQNGPTTSVALDEAARALNVVLALAPAFIALSANSPLESGRATGLQENRLTIWPRMFGDARFACDLALSRLPARPFLDLADYFRFAFGPGTVMQTVPLDPELDYKGAAHAARPLDDPSLLEFLRAEAWPALACATGEPVTLAPSAGHFEYLQFTPFLDARFRFRFGALPPVAALLQALERPRGLEALLAAHGAEGYIEGRVPGANFADANLIAEAGAGLESSAVMWASAAQAGLLANLAEAERLVADWGWERLRALRPHAIARAVHDPATCMLADEVLAVAEAGLAAGERRHLAYARWVLRNRRTGADRMLDCWRGLAGDADARLARLSERLRVVPPPLDPAA